MSAPSLLPSRLNRPTIGKGRWLAGAITDRCLARSPIPLRETAMCPAQLAWRDSAAAHRQYRWWMNPPPTATSDDAFGNEGALDRAAWRIAERIMRDPRVDVDVQLHYWTTLPPCCWPINAKAKD
jgi:hypothetical protein